MKTTIMPLLVVAMLASGAMADSDQYITVNVRVVADGTSGSSSGSGGFTVPEGEYGRTTLSFYGDGKSFSLTASGAKVGPVLHTTDPDDHQPHTDDLWMTMDLYLKPRVTLDENIELTGSMMNMVRSGDDDPPLYQYHEEKFEFFLPNGGEVHLSRRHSSAWKNVQIVISASSDRELAHKPKTHRSINLQTEYSLWNQSSDQYEAKDRRCTLGFGEPDHTSADRCRQRKMFYLEGGDSLLFLTSFNVSNVRWLDDHRFSFDFDIARYYALNPYDVDTLTSGGIFMNLGEHGLAAETLTIRDFHREITTRHGEKTEIEIPDDDDNPLPFSFVERIILTNTIETKSY
ncbi:MAG: hypothetical protein OEV49_08845 [candidate division Zixibacteria bacterium]|nr:hypothetical protein [candidate division Zixibacteria bacterium]MDH3937746.1 hypothetical protein [candidate division Zixibacteria bacterium]MDH4033086.1 hypothetical protein [candidate division Zixibacteria bacterium]